MGRNITSEAIILKTNRIGEIHKGLTTLTPSIGIINAIAHGAYKGRNKLSGRTDQFNISLFYLYFDPVKKTYKVSDIEPRHVFESIRMSLKKFYAASLWAEAIIKSFAGGEQFEPVFDLLAASVILLDNNPESRTDEVIVQFLYRYLTFIGYMPSLKQCEICSREIGTGEDIYIDPSGASACAACARSKEKLFSPGAIRYLVYTSRLPLASALKTSLDSTALSMARACLVVILQHVIEQPLSTLISSGGLL